MRDKAFFSARAEYGVRLLIILARQYGQGPLPLGKIAEAEGLPLPYLEQLTASLRRDGLITSHRGVKGGYELSRPPHEITMGQALRSLEGPITPMICASEDPDHLACLRDDYCSAQLLWTRVRDAVAEALDSTRLSELTCTGVSTAERAGGMSLQVITK